ncbi:MAG: hypothetical protein HFH87_11325 [Lachnospiraceae bacterium]|nr:hypothetical protein [Lachnospiraceae bacterium]
MNQVTNRRKKMDGAIRLMEVLSGVDEELLERCEQDDRRVAAHSGRKVGQRRWKYTGTWAAVLCLAVVGAVSWGGYKLTDSVRDNMPGAAGYDSAGSLEAIEVAPQEGIGQQEAGAVEEMAPSMAEVTDQQMVPEMKEDYMYTASGAEAEGKEDGGFPGSSAAADNNVTEGAVREMDKFKEAQQENAPVDNFNDSTACKSMDTRKLTEEEARSMEVLGSSVPSKLPQGYVFDNAYCYQETPEENLGMTWTRGTDSIMLYLSIPENSPATVDIGKPETYDERLYEIPHAETVPGEYRETVNDPVFAWEDMSLEVVRSRIVAREDAGDTNTPRGNFRVLYSNGVVLRFNGRGTPEEIWEMLCSCGSAE